jgi:hypothetical protein
MKRSTGISCNGMECNGMESNGIEWNRMEWNRIESNHGCFAFSSKISRFSSFISLTRSANIGM